MTDLNKAFSVQRRVRGPWRKYLDALDPFRADLHRYCTQLTGNIWDGEDLAQDALIKVFSHLGKIDASLDNPRAYLIRTATNLWIDRVRRSVRERALLELERVETTGHSGDQSQTLEVREAGQALMQGLHPQERAAIVLKEVLDYSLEESAEVLKTTVGAVKSALHRGRARLNESKPKAQFVIPPREMVEQFLTALASKDLETLEAICAADLSLELVGGAESNSFEQAKTFFSHAHSEMPILGFGRNPNWELIDFEGEPMVVGYRTLHGIEGVNEVHRIEVLDEKIVRVRTYCFCPEVLSAIARQLDKPLINRPITHRSPSLADVPGLLLSGLFAKR